MANKILSVVVPTYNMEAYLPRCLDSVTREDIPDTLEVIVVNDGSKDRSLEIAKEYQAKRPDIISIIDKPNGHYGSCINAALKVATGKYFRPLDADDWFDTDSLIIFLDKLSLTNDDLIITNHICHRITKDVLFKTHGIAYNKTYPVTCTNILKKMSSSFLSMHGFTFKFKILKEAHLNLTEGISYTDSEYIFFPLQNVRTFQSFNITLYHYDLTRESQSVNPSIAAHNHPQYATVLKRMLSVPHSYSYFEKKILCSCLRCYYYWLLFYCSADNELKQMNLILKKKDPFLKKMVFRDLMYTPLIWEYFGIHFFWYEKLKKILKIDR